MLDVNNKVLWSSGRTNGAGVIVDENDKPIDGELWWTTDCSARIEPEARIHQPHYQEITRQNQAQIYQELVSTPAQRRRAGVRPDAKPEGELTTSFLSICAKVKDNRILPQGFLKLDERIEISQAARRRRRDGGGSRARRESATIRTTQRGGGDSLVYRVPLSDMRRRKPAAVQATLYYQPTPPFYLQDRFCTSNSNDTKLLYYVAGKLDLAGTPAQDWKLRVVTSGPVRCRSPPQRRAGSGACTAVE